MNYSIKILVVDDEAATRLLLKRTLKKLGYYDVVIADDGRKALQEINNGDFDLIISDWHMPNMDGLEFFKAVKKRRHLEKDPFPARHRRDR